jgi:hypothetical protein
MYDTLFKNKGAVLAFVVLVLAAVQFLVGSEDGSGLFSRAKDEASQLAAPETQPDEPPAAVQKSPNLDGFYSDADVDFGDDSDLIDSAAGEDPRPIEGETFIDENDNEDNFSDSDESSFDSDYDEFE